MYILKNKSQLNFFVNFIREQLTDSLRFTPKPAKFKELISHCLNFNSYADAISNLPMDLEVFKNTFPRILAESLIAEPYGENVKVNKIKAIYNNAMSLNYVGSVMSFSEEVNHIKKDTRSNIDDEKAYLRKRTKDWFVLWVQQTIDNLESIKEAIKIDASQGKNSSVVMSQVLNIEPLAFDCATLRVTAGVSPNVPIMQSRRLLLEYDYQYECINSSLLPKQFNRRGLNGTLRYIDETVGKSVILDGTLIELWELLESIGLRPFFQTRYSMVDLCVQF
jgi:hypothetical protein